MQAIIPFSGFYSSLHDELINQAVDSLAQDDVGDPIPERVEQINKMIDYRKVLLTYSQLYVEEFCKNFSVELKFLELDSPREYNFTTDKVVCEISEDEVERIFDLVSSEELTRVAKERHTSCSGFSSFYDPDWTTWGAPDTWEPQQLCTLLMAHVGDADDYDLMGEHDLDGLIWDALPVGFEFSKTRDEEIESDIRELLYLGDVSSASARLDEIENVRLRRELRKTINEY